MFLALEEADDGQLLILGLAREAGCLLSRYDATSHRLLEERDNEFVWYHLATDSAC